MMSNKEEALFPHAEFDSMATAKTRTAQRRVENILRHRTRQRNRLLKRGRTDLAPWLQEDALDKFRQELAEQSVPRLREGHRAALTKQNRRALKPIAVKHLRAGVLVDAWIPYVDGSDYKRRPAVIVSANKAEVTVYPLTTSQHGRRKVPMAMLNHWEEAGLSRPCLMIQKQVTIPRTSLIGFGGELVEGDRNQFFLWVGSGLGATVRRSNVAQVTRAMAA